MTATARQAGTFGIGDDRTVHRLGDGAMQLTDADVDALTDAVG
ncbi:MAG: hypothetical protein ACR2KJ_16565 [Jatrophihabitans sp.]